MREGIAFAGNLIVDQIRRLDRLPRRSELATVRSIGRSTGGVCNSAIGFAILDPHIPVQVFGATGMDAEGAFILSELQRHGIRTDGIIRRGHSSFTDVYEESETNCRTMFHFGGANDSLDVNDIDYSSLSQRIFHMAYLLLLKTLDQPDDEYGSRMGRALSMARRAGCSTSLDIISEASDRYQTLARPTLRYVDYLMVNELEAERITGIRLMRESSIPEPDGMYRALKELFGLGISEWAVIHTPAGAFGMDRKGSFVYEAGKKLPDSLIKGAVGAGDAFSAGVLLAAYRGLPLKQALRYGNASAVRSLLGETATESMLPIEGSLAFYDSLPPQQPSLAFSQDCRKAE